MKTCFLSAFAFASGVGLAVSDQCNLATIETTLMANATIAAKLTPAKTKCETDTGVDIFNITAYPSKNVALKFQQSDGGCNVLINLVNGYANINTQCTVIVNGTVEIYGGLISDFLGGRTGNESASASGSVGDSESASASESGSSSNSTDAASSGASTTALSFVAYGAVAAIALALR